MAAVAVVRPLSVISQSGTWQFGDHDLSLTDLRLSLLDRGQSDHDCVVRRKRTGSARIRHSWRWSWKQMLTKPFQNPTWTRGGSLRSKGNRKKRKSSQGYQNVSKNSVEMRKKLDELYRIWHFEAGDSSDESSDDEYSERDRRRSCIPRLFARDSSSSEDETDFDKVEENQVSQYVKEGPARIMVDIIPKENETVGERLDLGGISEASWHRNDFSSESSLIHTPKEENICEVSDLNNPATEPDNFEQNSLKNTQNFGAIEQRRDRANSERTSTGVSQPIAKTAHNEELVKSFNSAMNTNDVSHDSLLLSQEGHSEGGHVRGKYDRIDLRAMTSTRATINNCRNNHVISTAQIYHRDILKRVDELCAQCGNEVYEGNEINLESTRDGTITKHGNKKIPITRESGTKSQRTDGNCFYLDSPQGSSRKESIEKQPTKHVVPDYPSSYAKIGAQQQMLSQNEEQYSTLQCEFKRFGCQFSGTNMAVQQHMQSSLNDHLKLVCKIAQDQKEQLQNQQHEQQKQSLLIQQLTESVNKLEKLVKEQSEASQSQDKTIQSVKDQMKDQRKQNQRFEREITSQIQALSQAPISSLPTGPCAAELVWPIKNFRKRLRRIQDGEMDDPLISDPFYTGAYGYKLSIWVYLNGRGRSVGDWVSVYARVMPSDHDNILSWPVRPTYTFTLLDQSEGEKDHIVRKRRVNDIKRDGGKHHGIQRPEGGERSVIVGFDDFVAHAQLERKKYVVEDCIYLKLEANIMY